MKKNTMSIAERKAELDKQRTRLEAFETIMDKIDSLIKWDCMEVKHDENGDIMYDDDGEAVYIAPSEDSWHYERYVALTGARDEILAII